MSNRFRRRLVQAWCRPWLVVFAGGILLPLAGGCRKERQWADAPLDTSPSLSPPGSLFDRSDNGLSTPMVSDGIENPQMVPAAEAGLAGSDAVIGVIVEGQPRAYPLERLSNIRGHIVNDVVEKGIGKYQPLTITYCDVQNCARVFAPRDPGETNSLQMGTMGMIDGELAVSFDGKSYRQTDKIPGLVDFEHTVTSWYSWRLDHPDTVVYTGRAQTFMP